MIRSLVVLAATSALVACQQKDEAPPSVTPAPAEVEEAEVAAVVEEEETAAAEDEQAPAVEITPAVVKRYVGYRQKVMDATRAEFTALRERAEKAKKDSTADQLEVLNETGKMEERLDAKTEAFRKEAGLSEEEVDALEDLVNDVATAALVVDQGSAMNPLLVQMKEQAKKLPAAQRAELEKEIASMEAGMKNLTEHTEAREKWGDPAVDAVLEHVDALRKMQKEALELFAKMR